MRLLDGIKQSRFARAAAPLGAVALAVWLSGCASMFKPGFHLAKGLDPEVHSARRADWIGKESVRCVVKFEDRYLMVKYRDGNWDFPGGPVIPEQHGIMDPDNLDLFNAALDYILSQAMVSVDIEDKPELFAYGYTIDNYNGENRMTHWVALYSRSTFPPQPHTDLREAVEVKWVSVDDPVLGECLRKRIQEYIDAGEGKSVIKERCRAYSIG